MVRHSRYLLLSFALILVLIGICLRRVVIKMEGSERRATGMVEGSATPAAGPAATPISEGQTGRARESKASTKLRSLLKVRQGELGMVRIPIGKAAAGLGFSLVGSGGEAGTPTILNVADIERFSKDLEARVSQEDLIEGAVKAAEGSFEWRSSNLEIKGQGLANSDEETTLVLNLRAGEQEVVTTFTAKTGSMFVINPGGRTEDAVLMVVGGRGTGEAR